MVPARLAKQTGAGDQRRLGVIPYRVPARLFEDAGIGEKYNISVSWRASLWREGKRRGSQHPREVGTADPRVETATGRRDLQNWEPACKRGAQEGTPLDPCGLAPFSLSRLGPDVMLLQEGAFLHSSNLKIKLHPLEVVVIETTTTQTTSPQSTHAPRYPAPTRRWSPDGHFSGRGWGNSLVALECNPQRHRSWCNLCTPRDDIDQARRLH